MWIFIDHGPDSGHRTEIAGDAFTIGRHPSSDLVLSDHEVSSHHATIERDAQGNYSLRDLGSTNGTFLNGSKVDGSVPINGTEQLSLGQTVMHLAGSPDATVVRRVAPATLPAPVEPEPAAAPEPAATSASLTPVDPPTTPAAPAATAAGTGAPEQANSTTIVAVIGGLLVVAAIVVVVVLVTGGSSSPAKKTLTPQQVIAQASPSVVRIQGDQGAGSGIIIDAKRQLVLTNAHVVVGNSALQAQIGNSSTETSPLQIVAADPCDDLAVMRLVTPIPHLKALSFGNSAALQAGSQVTVLGFPGSLQQTLGSDETVGQASSVVANTGTVSQVGIKATPDPSLPTYQNTIVHQAPVNHGDSGGPLLNNKGQVVGVNTLTNTENQGQYYAISANYIKRLLPGLEAGQSRGLIGWDLTSVTSDDPDLEAELESLYKALPAYAPRAAEYASVVSAFLRKHNINGMFDGGDQPGSAADTANTAGFLLTNMNGDPVPTLADVCSIVTSITPGNQVKVTGLNIAGGDPRDLGNVLSADVTIPTH